MARESSVRAGSGVSVLREGLVPGYPVQLTGMTGSNAVIINYEDIQSTLGIIQASGLTVTSDAVQVSGPATRLRGRRQLRIQNQGAASVFIGGDSGVTGLNGYEIANGDSLTLNILDVGDVWIATLAASANVRVLELK